MEEPAGLPSRLGVQPVVNGLEDNLAVLNGCDGGLFLRPTYAGAELTCTPITNDENIQSGSSWFRHRHSGMLTSDEVGNCPGLERPARCACSGAGGTSRSKAVLAFASDNHKACKKASSACGVNPTSLQCSTILSWIDTAVSYRWTTLARTS